MQNKDFKTGIIEMLRKYMLDTKSSVILDILLRSNYDIISSFINFILEDESLKTLRVESFMNKKTLGLILCGNFGNTFLNEFQFYSNLFYDVILVDEEAKSKEGNSIRINKKSLASDEYIFIDASYYTGATKNKIDTALQKIDKDKHIVKTYVIYDGNHNMQDDVLSMFKWYYDRPVS